MSNGEPDYKELYETLLIEHNNLMAAIQDAGLQLQVMARNNIKQKKEEKVDQPKPESAKNSTE